MPLASHTRTLHILGLRNTKRLRTVMNLLRTCEIVADVVGDVATCQGTPANWASFDRLSAHWKWQPDWN
jgi:hypothetical protein